MWAYFWGERERRGEGAYFGMEKERRDG